jgi:DNA-binding NarL/FixJ family response regulator
MNSNDPVTVLVAGPTARMHDLAAFLPDAWVVLRRERLDGTPVHADIIVMLEPFAAAITRACLADPQAAVIAVLSPYSDHEDVVRTLDAGADACVRTQNAAIVAAHVEACHRRQVASPWYAAA